MGGGFGRITKLYYLCAVILKYYIMNITAVIKKQGFTQDEVAAKMGINRVNLNTAINGNPTIKTLQKIAEAIGVSVAEFFRDEITDTQPSEIILRYKSGDVTYKLATPAQTQDEDDDEL